MGSPEIWAWIWLAAAVLFGLGELTAPGSFFLLPFSVGAIVAMILAFLGVPVGWEWLAFVVVSGAAFAGLHPLGRRLDERIPHRGVGADRLIGKEAKVTATIPAGAATAGNVRVESEDWRARSVDGTQIQVGATVEVVRLEGTHLIVNVLGGAAADELNP